MSKYTIHLATADDNAELCALFALPMKGNISLSFSRSPDYFTGSCVQNEITEVYICRNVNNGSACAIFSVGKRRVFRNGNIIFTPYFADLRIDEKARDGRLLLYISKFLNERNIPGDDEAQTIIFSDNSVMLSLIEKQSVRKNSMSMHYYNFTGNYISYILPSQRIGSTAPHLTIRQATIADIPDMQRFLEQEGPKKDFFPYYNFAELTAGNSYYHQLTVNNFYIVLLNDKIYAMAGIWDQSAFKRTLVGNYSGILKTLRPLINIVSKITGGINLPAPGNPFSYVYLHCILITNNNTAVFKQLVDHILSNMPSDSCLLVGLDAADDLCEPLNKYKHTRKIAGKHYLVSSTYRPPKSKRSFYLESARI